MRNRADAIPENKLKMILAKTKKVKDCLEWQGNYFYRLDGSKSYPYIYFRNKAHRGNRLVLSFVTGVMRKDRYALHTCDNTFCLNPNHLYWGTNSDNSLDAVSRGRHKETKKTHCPQGHQYSKENTAVRDNKRYCLKCRKYKNSAAFARLRANHG